MAGRAELILVIRTDVPRSPIDAAHEHVRTLYQGGDTTVNNAIGTAHFDKTSQSPPYALAAESLSLSPITGHEANSRSAATSTYAVGESLDSVVRKTSIPVH